MKFHLLPEFGVAWHQDFSCLLQSTVIGDDFVHVIVDISSCSLVDELVEV